MGVVAPLQVPPQLGFWLKGYLSHLLGIIKSPPRGQTRSSRQVSLHLLLPRKTLMLKIQKVIIFILMYQGSVVAGGGGSGSENQSCWQSQDSTDLLFGGLKA